MVTKKKTIPFQFGDKHKLYIRRCADNVYNVAEGAVRAGKTVDHIYAFAHELKTCKDKIHLASGSTVANAKLNIGDANGFGLEYIFRGQGHWGKYKDNDCLYIKGPDTGGKQKIVIFAGGSKANSFQKIRGNSYGMWIATEINQHHDTFIKEAFNRQLAADKRKIFWDLNPDNPNAPIYTEYIDKYAELNEQGVLLGGYNYEHFTIDDNVNIPQQRIDEIKSQYDPNSIWYLRDIKGLRCVAEGLIYRQFADQTESFLIDTAPDIIHAVIGVDFGGNKSAHSFKLTGFTKGYREVITLDEYYLKKRITPAQLENDFIDFVKRSQQKYRVYEAYCDSAEQVLISGLESAVIKARIPIDIKNAIKGPVNDRIAFYNSLMARGRYKVMRHCKHLISAFQSAVYDEKAKDKDVRLDNGIMDIDSLDSQEYTTEYIQDDILYL
jgi:PBSX family phage terminase large subunit